MNDALPMRAFSPAPPDAAGVVSWVHLGDLHMTRAGEQNHVDLLALVDMVNSALAGTIAFVYLPGDIADDGSAAAYTVVRDALDRLQAPWCSIIGDHDVHEKSFGNYLAFMGPEKHYAFSVGSVRFVALNAFDVPDPGSFTVLPEQMSWLEEQLAGAEASGLSAVLLLHCYPTDLKQGGERLGELARRPVVRLIDMGHTHYNEVSNDGQTLYTATRSTGQIEEGPVGFSITNVDGAVISWKFVPLGELPVVMITSPADERLITDATLAGHVAEGKVTVRVKAWGAAPIVSVVAVLEGREGALAQVPGSAVWQGEIDCSELSNGVYALSVRAEDFDGKAAEDSIRLVVGSAAYQAAERAERDQDNAVGAWPERGLLGTQLGPNKNGRKW